MNKSIVSFLRHASGISLWKSVRMALDYKEKYQCRIDFICRYIGDGEVDGYHSRFIASDNMGATVVTMAREIKRYYDLGYYDIGDFQIDFDGCFRYLKSFVKDLPVCSLERIILRMVFKFSKYRKAKWTKTL